MQNMVFVESSQDEREAHPSDEVVKHTAKRRRFMPDSEDDSEDGSDSDSGSYGKEDAPDKISG